MVESGKRTVVNICIVIFFCIWRPLFASEYNYKITDYTTNFNTIVDTLSTKNIKEKVKWWLVYEKEHFNYFDAIYWKEISPYPNEKKRKKIIRNKVSQLFNSTRQIKLLSDNAQTLLIDTIHFIDSYYHKTPSVHLFLSISPVSSDAKTQWYGNDHNAIHLNALNSSFANPKITKIIFAHELFHLFQEQALRKINQGINYNSISGKLIAEGMATYFANLYVKDANINDILLFSKDKYNTILQQENLLTKDIFQVFDSSDEKTIKRYFSYGAGPYPPRSGYYIAYVLIKRLAGKHDFKTLTYLNPQELTFLLKEELKLMVQNFG